MTARAGRLGVLVAGVVGLALAGCRPAAPPVAGTAATGGAPGSAGGLGATTAPVPGTTLAATSAPGGDTAAAALPAQVGLASTDLAVGHERFAFSLLDPAGALLPGATARVTFYHLDGEAANPVASQDATFHGARLEQAGLYVVYQDFDRAGPWGAEITATAADGRPILAQRVRFEVADEPQGVAVGSSPPPTANRTLATEPDLARLTSDAAPDPDLYRLTVDEAAASGRPTVVLFSTPGFCQSRICQPVTDEVKAVKRAYGDRVNFVHIEVYKSFDPLVPADELAAWGLKTEPWVYVLDRAGRVAERLEGSVTAAELTPILARLAGG